MKHIYKILLISFIFVCSITFVSAQEFQVVVNSKNAVKSLTKKQVSDYFLKKKTKWSDGTKIIPVDLSSKSKVRTSFSKKIHKKSTVQVRAYWQQSVFSGKASPPSEKTSDAVVINYVKTHKGAIGYISSKTKASGVKVLTVK